MSVSHVLELPMWEIEGWIARIQERRKRRK